MKIARKGGWRMLLLPVCEVSTFSQLLAWYLLKCLDVVDCVPRLYVCTYFRGYGNKVISRLPEVHVFTYFLVHIRHWHN